MSTTVKFFSGTSVVNLSTAIAAAYGKSLSDISIERFSDGEIAVRFNESVRGTHIYLIQSTFPPADNMMELLLMIDAAKRASAKTVAVVIPYYGYARQDRKDQSRVAIAAKLQANLLYAAGADRLITCDLHADQIQGFFDIPVDHLESTSLFIPYIQKLNLPNLVLAAPDVGSIIRVRSYAQFFNVPIVICDKYRKKANEIASIQLIGNVEHTNVILIDDLIDTGNTLCKAAALLKRKGAKSVRALCTHPILSGDAYQHIQSSVLEELIVTDTIPLKQSSNKIKILSIAPVLAQAIQNIHKYQ